MKILDIIKDANANLLRNKLRSFLTILAIFIGSFSIISTSAIQAGVNDFIDSQVDSYGGVQTGMSPITDEQMEKLKKIEGIDADSIVEQKTLDITYITSKETDKKYLVAAEALPPGNVKVDVVTGKQLDLRADEYQIQLEQKYVSALGYTNEDIIDKEVQLVVVDEYTRAEKTFDAKVVGVIAPGVVSMGQQYTNNKLADDIYEENTKYYPDKIKTQTFAVAANFDYEKYSVDDIKDKLEEIGLSGMTIEDIIGTIKTFFDVILTVFKIFGLIALIAAAIGIINTLFMSVQERTREIGLDKALGMSSSKVFLSFSLEAIALGFWGSVFGITVSMILGNLVNTAFHAEGGFLEAFPTFNLATYTIPDIISVTVLIMVIAFLSGTLPARRAAHKNPIDALRYE